MKAFVTVRTFLILYFPFQTVLTFLSIFEGVSHLVKPHEPRQHQLVAINVSNHTIQITVELQSDADIAKCSVTVPLNAIGATSEDGAANRAAISQFAAQVIHDCISPSCPAVSSPPPSTSALAFTVNSSASEDGVARLKALAASADRCAICHERLLDLCIDCRVSNNSIAGPDCAVVMGICYVSVLSLARYSTVQN